MDTALDLHIHNIRPYKGLLSKSAEHDLFREYQRTGDVALRNRIALRHSGLVIWVAKRFKRGDIELMDLIQEGNLILMDAIERFELREDSKFSAYAFKIIKWGLHAYTLKFRTPVSVPSYALRKRFDESLMKDFDYISRNNETSGIDDSLISEDTAELTAQSVYVSILLNKLKPKESEVLCGRLADMTLQEIGDSMGISKQAVNHIEKQALAKVKRRIGVG